MIDKETAVFLLFFLPLGVLSWAWVLFIAYLLFASVREGLRKPK